MSSKCDEAFSNNGLDNCCSYVHGIMDGEVIVDLEDRDGVPEKFSLI